MKKKWVQYSQDILIKSTLSLYLKTLKLNSDITFKKKKKKKLYFQKQIS